MPMRPMVEKVVVESSEIPLGVGIQALVQKLGDHVTLDLQGTGGNIHHMVQTAVEIRLVSGQGKRYAAY